MAREKETLVGLGSMRRPDPVIDNNNLTIETLEAHRFAFVRMLERKVTPIGKQYAGRSPSHTALSKEEKVDALLGLAGHLASVVTSVKHSEHFQYASSVLIACSKERALASPDLSKVSLHLDQAIVKLGLTN